MIVRPLSPRSLDTFKTRADHAEFALQLINPVRELLHKFQQIFVFVTRDVDRCPGIYTSIGFPPLDIPATFGGHGQSHQQSAC